VARLQRKNFSKPAEVRRFPRGRLEVVELDDVVVGRMIHRPGWRWSVDVRPIAGTERCQYRHLGVVVQGRLHIELDDGAQMDIGPGDVFELPPGHDAWVVGEESWIALDFAGVRSYARPAERRAERALASILFSDVVGSTETAAAMGEEPWREMISQHNERSQAVVDRFGGRVVQFTGDGMLASFSSAERAARAAKTLIPWVNELDLHLRVGIHTGEVEQRGEQLRGLTLHVASRVMALAGSDEIFVSSTVRDLLEGSDLTFEDRGRHRLKGLDGERQLFALT
jgi:class 3 adenylate cyclase